jgi:hypothetical protein
MSCSKKTARISCVWQPSAQTPPRLQSVPQQGEQASLIGEDEQSLPLPDHDGRLLTLVLWLVLKQGVWECGGCAGVDGGANPGAYGGEAAPRVSLQGAAAGL